jgi:dTDP-4-dehydrorhamnose reductase
VRILVTGMNGTVGPRFAENARRSGHEIVPWRRDVVSPENPAAGRAFLAATAPDAVVHLAFGPEAWAALMAEEAHRRAIPFVYSSTAMVFAQRPDGPYTTTSPRTADEEYGRYKIRCEDAVLKANPDATVVRLAYQIDPGGIGNNLVAHLDAAAAGGREVLASVRWVPALAFLDDTADALLSFVADPEPGTHHLDANAETAWTYFEVVTALRNSLGRHWRVTAGEDPAHDQRLLGSRRIAGLDTRLGAQRL